MISAVIITYNEERQIEKCIKSLEGIVDEVILVDAMSEDKTIELAVQTLPTIKTYVKSWEGYGASKNYGVAQAKNDWILSIDADELCSVEMKDAILRTSLSLNHYYSFKRINHFGGRAMKYGMLRPEWKPRLYHRDIMMWDDRLVHEQLTKYKNDLDQKLSTVKLRGSIIHHAYDDYEDHIKHLYNYAQLSAVAWMKQGLKPSLIQKRIGPTYHFFRNYFFRLGCLEGRPGYETSKAAYLYSKYKYQAFEKLKSL